MRDTCFNIDEITIDTANIVINNIDASLQLQVDSTVDERDYTILKPNITYVRKSNNKVSSFIIKFKIPDNIIGNWDLNVLVDEIPSRGMPWINAVTSREPTPPAATLPIWAFVLLLLLVLLIIGTISFVLYRLYRYRQKLKLNQEYIEAGKKQAELDALENNMVYKMNPMLGTLEDLKAQLEKNERELAELRKRGEGGVDQTHIINQLQVKRDGLVDEMNRLKKEKQQKEAVNIKSNNVVNKKTQRKKFGQQMA